MLVACQVAGGVVLSIYDTQWQSRPDDGSSCQQAILVSLVYRVLGTIMGLVVVIAGLKVVNR